jgi:transposase
MKASPSSRPVLEEVSGNSQQSSTIITKHSYTPRSFRDQRLKARTLHDLGWSYQAISKELDLTIRQVQTAVTNSHPTPEKRKERPSILSPHHIQILIEWVTAFKANRRMPWNLIPEAVASRLGFLAGIYAIRNALRLYGFNRRVTRRKPPIIEVNRLLRLQFAIEHLN